MPGRTIAVSHDGSDDMVKSAELYALRTLEPIVPALSVLVALLRQRFASPSLRPRAAPVPGRCI